MMSQTQELLRQHGDAIRAQSIDRPLIVIGLPRSGTSAITNLLAQHHKLQSVVSRSLCSRPATDAHIQSCCAMHDATWHIKF